MLVEGDAVGLVLVEMLLFEGDTVILLEVVLVLNIDVEFEELTIVELNDVVCVCARAENPGNDNRRARKAMVMRMHAPISLPKLTTSTPD